jgi:hypothetical protein
MGADTMIVVHRQAALLYSFWVYDDFTCGASPVTAARTWDELASTAMAFNCLIEGILDTFAGLVSYLWAGCIGF